MIRLARLTVFAVLLSYEFETSAQVFTAGSERSLKDVLRDAPEDTEIILQPGITFVDNPIVLDKAGLKILGKNGTVLRPMNVGQAVIEVAASRVSIGNLTIDARVRDDQGLAAFGVFIRSGSTRCTVRDSRIRHTGATAILGDGVTDCVIRRNKISHAGDDGIRLRGSGLVVSDNVVTRYFDEAIDLAEGKNLVVARNEVSLGRIGVTVGKAKHVTVSGNEISDQIEGGMNVEDAAVIGNVVRNVRDVYYKLRRPIAVFNNEASGYGPVGFRLTDMTAGVVQDNLVKGPRVGFEMAGGRNIDVFGNTYCGDNSLGPEEGVAYVDQSDDTTIRGAISCTFATNIAATKRNQVIDSATVKLLGHGDRDLEIASSVAGLFRIVNPGVISVSVSGYEMRSEITRELFETLVGTDQLAAGIVRMPYNTFRWMSDSAAPLWYLSYSGQTAAIVTWHYGPNGVMIRYLADGRVGFVDSISLQLVQIIASIGTALKSMLIT